jgi:hypothetical protein
MAGFRDREEGRDAAPGGFKVVDRRRFTAAGELRTELPAEAVPQAAPPVVAEPTPAAPAPAAASVPGADSGVDFLSFIGSLATNAMAAMGLLPPAQSRGMPKNLAMASEYIEIIVMLQARTQGNLTAEEAQAMAGLVHDLRLQFAELQNPRPAVAPARSMPQL